MACGRGASSGPGVTAADAHSVLEGLERDSARLATRLPTPWGVLCACAALVAVFVGADALFGNGWGSIIGPAAILGVVAVLSLASRRSGVKPSGPIGSRATWLFLAMFGTLMLAKIAAWILADAGAATVWAALPMTGAFAGVLLLGAASHREMRGRLARHP